MHENSLTKTLSPLVAKKLDEGVILTLQNHEKDRANILKILAALGYPFKSLPSLSLYEYVVFWAYYLCSTPSNYARIISWAPTEKNRKYNAFIGYDLSVPSLMFKYPELLSGRSPDQMVNLLRHSKHPENQINLMFLNMATQDSLNDQASSLGLIKISQIIVDVIEFMQIAEGNTAPPPKDETSYNSIVAKFKTIGTNGEVGSCQSFIVMRYLSEVRKCKEKFSSVLGLTDALVDCRRGITLLAQAIIGITHNKSVSLPLFSKDSISKYQEIFDTFYTQCIIAPLPVLSKIITFAEGEALVLLSLFWMLLQINENPVPLVNHAADKLNMNGPILKTNTLKEVVPTFSRMVDVVNKGSSSPSMGH